MNIITQILLLVITPATLFDLSGAQIGAAYGRNGNNLPSPAQIVRLFSSNGIRRMRIYDPNPATLQALRGTNIELMIGVPNGDLRSIAGSQNAANSWVQNNVRNYGNVRFRYIAVGNEVSPFRGESSQYVQVLLPALRNIQNAVNQAGLGGRIRVSTAIDTGLIGNSYPPRDGAFRSDAEWFITPIVQFLSRNRSPLLANIYPYFSYIYNKAQISLPYALFTGDGVVAGGVRYQNLLYAMYDSVAAAVQRVGGGGVDIVISETGWPSEGGDATSLENERVYVTNLIRRVQAGTPLRPGRPIETYIFGIIDENLKNPEYEKHWGIFYSNMQPKFSLRINHLNDSFAGISETNPGVKPEYAAE